MKTDNFRNWTGGSECATVAVVFNDIVDKTALNVKIDDTKFTALDWNEHMEELKGFPGKHKQWSVADA